MKPPALVPKTYVGSKAAAVKFGLNLAIALKSKKPEDAYGACDTAFKFFGTFKKEFMAPAKWDVDLKKRTKW
jgi:hypothetical protein